MWEPGKVMNCQTFGKSGTKVQVRNQKRLSWKEERADHAGMEAPVKDLYPSYTWQPLVRESREGT